MLSPTENKVEKNGVEEMETNQVGPNIDSIDDEDEARSEATFRYVIPNFSKVKETLLSPPTFVRNLPWKIMIMQRTNQGQDRQPTKSLGFFLQCNGESESTMWSCNATAELRLISQKEGVENFQRKIQHLFYYKENDWGFSHFMSWNEVADPDKGYIKDDSLILEVWVTADAPHGVCWDSKKHTGYVGLKNQGATCYMNSLLQTLFFTNKLRKAVYQMPTENDDSSKSVSLALQRVFYELQFSDKPVGTKKLTKSFGWETFDCFMQHDVQELCRVLLDNMESKMKSTCVEGSIPRIFEGKMTSFIRCKSVDCTSKKEEPFYDIQLNVKGKRNITESFQDYCSVETLEGENKYDAGKYGLQDAEKGIIFASFPPVLHLHLLRFQYDPLQDSNVKINDRFEFPEKLNLDQFLQQPEEVPAWFTLHAVLVHSGDNHGGHYVVFINPKGDGRWCKFDDDVVSRCSKREAIDFNFGGGHEDELAMKQSTNAYMLVYIKDKAIADMLAPLSEEDIPAQLVERLNEEKRQEIQRRKERNEAHLYMNVQIVTEENFIGHQGHDLFDVEKTTYKTIRVKKVSPLKELFEIVSSQLNYPLSSFRLWPIVFRNNRTCRPVALDTEAEQTKTVIEIAENMNPWTMFIESSSPEKPLPPFDTESEVLLFFKLYDPVASIVTYCGYQILPISLKATDLIPLLNERASFDPNTPLLLYEEIKPNLLEKIDKLELALDAVLDELMDGDILIFQKACHAEDTTLAMPTAEDYYRELHYRLEITFCDKSITDDPGFTLTLSMRTDFQEMVKAVAEKLDTAPYLIQFFRSQSYREVPGNPLRPEFEGTMRDLFLYYKPKQSKKLFYNRLTISINDLPNKRMFKCIWFSKNKEEKEITLYPNKNGTVSDLLEEAKKEIQLPKDGSGKIRFIEIMGNKIFSLPCDNMALEDLHAALTKIYRLEEVPLDEVSIEEDEVLIPVAHFSKETFSTFGDPFLIKIKQNETFPQVKERIQKKLDICEKDLEKYKFAIVVLGKPQYIEESTYVFNIQDFIPSTVQSTPPNYSRLWLGLDHLNKNSKRSRYNYVEKAIKIHN